MPIVLYRVDERLIHGQVVIGWSHELRPGRYLVVDDVLSDIGWERDLYRLGAGDATTEFATVEDAVRLVSEWRSEPVRSILLTRDIAAMRALGDAGLLRGEEVNLGGLHHGPGRAEVLTYLHLGPEDLDDLRALVASGARVSARDLPDAHRVPVENLLR